jgi:hypothetical protein
VQFGTFYSNLVISDRSLLRSKCKQGIIRVYGSTCSGLIDGSG